MSAKEIAKRLYTALKGRRIDTKVATELITTYQDNKPFWNDVGFHFRGISGHILDSFIPRALGGNTCVLMKASKLSKNEYIHSILRGDSFEAKLDTLLMLPQVTVMEIQDQYRLRAHEKKGLHQQGVHHQQGVQHSLPPPELYMQFDDPGVASRLIQMALCGARDQSEDSATSVDHDVEALRKATKGAGTDPNPIVELLGTCSHVHYRLVADAFASKYGKTLEKVFKGEFSGIDEYATLLMHHYLLDPMGGIAYMIRSSMVGLGTNEERLIRAMVLFFNGDNGKAVYDAYCRIYGKGKDQLSKDIRGDCSGFFRDMLLAMVERNSH